MRSRAWELVVYGPIVLCLVIIAEGALILLGPSMGGSPGTAHSALRDAFARESAVYADPVGPIRLVGAQRSTQGVPLPSEEDTAIPELVSLPADASPTARGTCAAVQFEAALSIERNYVSFGRFNVVNDTDPYGRHDPLTQWKLLQFGGFPIGTEVLDPTYAASIPVNQTVNLLISDPYTQEMLFSAKWKIESIEVRGRYASINAALSPNLSGLGVSNVIESPALESFSRDGRGVLVMRFQHTDDIAPALKSGEPIYAAVTGTMMPYYCAH